MQRLTIVRARISTIKIIIGQMAMVRTHATSNNSTSPHIALIGCGQWGRNIARNLKASNSLAAICDSHYEQHEDLEKHFDCPVVALPDILVDQQIDGIAIATPPETHHTLALECLTAGKHIFIEKPLALCLTDAISIEKTARQAAKHVMVGHLIRHHNGFHRMIEMISDDRIGKVRHIEAKRLSQGPPRIGESVLYDLCPHDLALVYALTGGAKAQAVTCDDRTQDANTITARCHFIGGITADLTACWAHETKVQRLTVTGDNGSLDLDMTQSWDKMLTLTPKTTQQIAIPVDASEPLANEMAAFIASVRNNTPPLTDLAEALYVQHLLTLIEDASRERYNATS